MHELLPREFVALFFEVIQHGLRIGYDRLLTDQRRLPIVK